MRTIVTRNDSVTAVLVSKFLLDLQAANRNSLNLHRQEASCTETSEVVTGSLVFERVVGSLGSMISPGALDDLGIDDESTADPSDAEAATEKISCTSADNLELV